MHEGHGFSANALRLLRLIIGAAQLVQGSEAWSEPPNPLLLAPYSYGSYQLGPVCVPSDPIRTPATVRELVHIIREALARGTTVKAFGNRHSATDIICTSGIPVDMRRFRAMSYDPMSRTVTVGAGAFLRDVCSFAQAYDRGFRTTPGYGHITIGGAIGTGAHGSSIRHQASMSSQVVGLTIVDGMGRVRRISDEADLRAWRVHLGLLGIVVEVTLATSPLYKVLAHNYVVDDDILTNGVAATWAEQSDQISLYWFPSQKQVVVSNWTIVDPSTPGDAWTNDHVPTTSFLYNVLSHTGTELIQSKKILPLLFTMQALSKKTLVGQVRGFVPIYTEDGMTVSNPAVGIYHLMFAPICGDGRGGGERQGSGWFQCPWLHGPFNITILDNEVSIGLRDLASFVQSTRAILAVSPAAFPLQGILLRFSRASTTLMDNAYGRDTVHVEWYTPLRQDPYGTASSGIAAYQAMMQTMVEKYRGRSHWGKSGSHYHSTPLLARKLSANVRASFLRKMREFDPEGVFLNDFGRRLMGTSTRANTDPFTRHCALLDNCVCNAPWDCAPDQTCTVLKSFPVCTSVIDPWSELWRLGSGFLTPLESLTDFSRWMGRLLW